MEFSFGDEYKDGPLALGMHKRGSFHDIVNVENCQIVDEDYRKILTCTLEASKRSGLPYYHRMRHTGYFRHLLVRKAVKTGEILIDLVTKMCIRDRTCGIVDIFMHTIERYFTPEDGNELTDEIAEGLLRTLIRNGLKAVEHPKDYDALSEIMWCGSLSHNNLTGLGRPKDFACHKLGHEIGGMFDEAHGATLSCLLYTSF